MHRVRCVVGDEGVLAESSRVACVNYGAAREDVAHRVACDGRVEMLPVYEVAAHRVSPVHVAPLRSVRVVLEVEVILTVLIGQSVGIIHPSVERSVMINGTIVVGIGGVEGVRQLQLLQRYGILRQSYNLHHSLLALRKGERNRVVCLADGESNVHPCVGLLAVVEQHLSLGTVLLDRKDEVFGRVVYCNDGCIASECGLE